MNKEKYLFIIGGSILQVPLLKVARDLGLKTIISDFNKNCIAHDKCDLFLNINIFDIESHIEFLKETDLNVVAAIASGIDVPETMAAMNEFLGVKGISLEKALLVKSKDKFRKKMKELKYETPNFQILDKNTKNKIIESLEKLNFPIIVKPNNNCGSKDMKIFHNFDESLIDFIKKNIEKYEAILLEEVWVGKEQTVEAIINIEGEFCKGFITDREFVFKDGYPVETGLVHPSQLDEKMQNELFNLAKNVANDLEIDVGIVKLDTIITDTGPKIIELTVRNAGGFDPQYLVPIATGKEVLKATILTLLGRKFNLNLLQSKFNKFSVSGSIWPTPGKILSIENLDDALRVEGVEHIFFLKNIGDFVREYTDSASRFIYIICSGNTVENAKESLKKVQKILKIETTSDY